MEDFPQHFGYNDEEMKRFRENSRNEDVLTKSPGLMNKTIIVKVVESRECNAAAGDISFWNSV